MIARITTAAAPHASGDFYVEIPQSDPDLDWIEAEQALTALRDRIAAGEPIAVASRHKQATDGSHCIDEQDQFPIVFTAPVLYVRAVTFRD